MLSIIICSARNNLYELIQENISSTIGVPYELIRIYNPEGNIGICKAYNEGASKAIYSILCFIHEDIIFRTQDWGQKLLDHFQRLNNPGVIGFAGAVYKSRALSSWWQEMHYGFEPKRCRLQQYFKYNPFHPNYTYCNPLDELSSEVVSLDGFFLSMTKETWKQYPYDENMLKGFHGYDLDICLSITASKKNYAVMDILVEHHSEGQNNECWLLDNLSVHHKHEAILPMVIDRYKDLRIDFEAIDSQWDRYWLKEMIRWALSPLCIVDYYMQLKQLHGKKIKYKYALVFEIIKEYMWYWEQKLNDLYSFAINKGKRGFLKIIKKN